MPRNIFYILIAVFMLSACQTPMEEPTDMEYVNVPPSRTCFEDAMNDSFLYMCLNDLLEQADARMTEVSAEQHATARAHEEEFEKRAAIKDLSNSNLAFSTYRDAECTRRAMLGDTRQVKEDILLGCKVDLTRQRIENFFVFN